MDKYFIDSHKLYWHLDRVIEWREKGSVIPIYIEVSPVAYCNHQCLFCAIDFAQEKAVQLDSAVFCKKIKEMGKLGVKSIMFAGEGEPLLHKDLPVMVKAAKDAGIDVSLTTNGATGTYEIWNEILPCLTWARFSVDAGTSKIYAKVHNVTENIFNKTINCIKEAVNVKKKYNLNTQIGIQFVVIEENYKDLEKAICLFREMGVDYLSIKPYSLHPGMINKKEVVYNKEIIQYIQKIVDAYKEKPEMDVIFRKDALESYANQKITFSHCNALPFWGYISSKGDFYTCSVFIGDERFKAGNIYKESMESIFSGKKRMNSIEFGKNELSINGECRTNCRMARINEFLEFLENKPMHINFI